MSQWKVMKMSKMVKMVKMVKEDVRVVGPPILLGTRDPNNIQKISGKSNRKTTNHAANRIRHATEKGDGEQTDGYRACKAAMQRNNCRFSSKLKFSVADGTTGSEKNKR